MKTFVRFSILLTVFAVIATGAWAQSVTLNDGQTNSVARNLSSSATLTITVNSGTATYSGVISGGGTNCTVEKRGPGKLIITGANTVNCKIQVFEGILQIGNGTIGHFNNAQSVQLEASTTILRFEPMPDMVFAAAVSGLGSVEYDGVGPKTMKFTGNLTHSGTTTIERGYLWLGNNGTTGSISGDIVIKDSGAWLDFRRTNNYNYDGVISGAGNIYKYNGGTVTLRTTSTYTGETRISDGTLSLSGRTVTFLPGGSIEASAGVWLMGANSKFSISANKTIKALNSTQANAEVILGTNTLQIGINSISSDGSGTYAGKITGTGTGIAINKNGTGTLTLSGTSNTYSGNTDINSGVLVFSASGSLGTSTVRFYGGTLRWAASNTADISGRLLFGSPSGTVDIGANNVTFSSAFQTSTGNIIKMGSGTLTINAPQTYTGATNINAGTLTLGSSGTIESSSGVTIGSATAKLNISISNKRIRALSSTYSGAEVVLGPRILNIGTNATSANGGGSFAGVISGDGGINKTGTETLTLSGANTYEGPTAISAGTLALGNAGTIANSSGVSLEGNTGKFSISLANKTIKRLSTSATTYTGAEVILGANTLTIGTSATSADGGGTFAGVISGDGGITKRGTETLTLSGINTYQGTTAINTGQLTLASGGTIANSSGVSFTSSTGKFSVSSANKTIKGLYTSANTYTGAEVILGTRTLTIGTSATSADGGGSFAGYFSGTSGGVTKTGTAVFALRGNNTVNGTFTHSAGTVDFRGEWSGNYIKNNNTELTVVGEPIVRGNLSLEGGIINLSLTTTPTSRLGVGGTVSTTRTNTINITNLGTANNYSLMTAASGINIANFALTGTSNSYKLTVNGAGSELALVNDGTGIVEVEQDNQLKAWILNGSLHLKGVVAGEALSVYNATGALIYQNADVSSGELDILLPAQGVYIVRQGLRVIKVLGK